MSLKRRGKKSPYRVKMDPVQDPDTYRAALLVAGGMATNYITNETGLTPGQVSYRVKFGKLIGARADFRNGRGIFARAYLESGLPVVEKKLKEHLRETLG